MSKHKNNKHRQQHQHQPFSPQPALITEKTDDGDWVPLMTFKLDKDAMCRRLEQGIPSLLAMIIPSDMEISVVGTHNEEAVYIVRKVVVCGTAEDIIDHLAAQQGTAS